MLKPGLVRFILASLVVLFHVTKFVFIGSMAVYCFFILSGYWITLMYEKKYAKIDKGLRVFYISRFLRIAPVFYLISILNFLVLFFYKDSLFNTISFSTLGDCLRFLPNIFLFGYNSLETQFLVPSWSLDIEMQFYLLTPFLLFLTKTKNGRMLVFSLCVFCALFIFISNGESFLAKTIMNYILYFVIGIILFKSKVKFTSKVEYICNFIFLLILVVHYLTPDLFNLVRTTSNAYNVYFNILGSFFLIPFLSNSVLRKSDNRDTLLGGMSYAIYLVHWVFIAPYNYYIEGLGKLERIPYLFIFIGCTYYFSYLIYKFYDLPIDKYRKRWVQKQV